MNRNEEYMELTNELDALDAPRGVVERAMRRDKRRRYLVRPLSTLAAAFALFVVLVNFSAPVAHACSRVPGLRELAEAVTFSRSLSDAVDNEYVQPVNLTQTHGDITVTVEYLIVDQKNVTVFYRVESERYPRLRADPFFSAADGGSLSPVTWGVNNYGENGELQSAHVGFADSDVPPEIRMTLKLLDREPWRTGQMPENHVWDDTPEAEPDYVAQFDFLLEFDPYFTAQGRHYALDQSVILDGQTLHITNIDVYPSYLELTVKSDESSSAWLESLSFYLVTDKGEQFDRVSNGITATGSPDTPDMSHYRADSTFFYDASSITLYFTGAEWLDKDADTIHVDLKNKVADTMPDDARLYDVTREGNRWIVTVLRRAGYAQTFMHGYYDAEGNRYEINTGYASSTYGDVEAPKGYTFESMPLNNYPYDEVWLTPRYTSRWTTETPVAVTVELK